jgi:hypothetical protein
MAQSIEKDLDEIQSESFKFFAQEYNPAKGLIRDKSGDKAPASIAAIGFALATYVVAVERGFMKRSEALKRCLATVKFFGESDQNPQGDATGYKGFYYHFLDFDSGRRTWDCELSTIDTGLLLLGMLVAAEYFSGDNAKERELRERVQQIYARVEWKWACNLSPMLTHGYRPGRGFLRYHWQGYSEGLLLYILGLGAPEHSLSPASYHAWTETYKWKRIYDFEFLYAGPLFIHQFLHVWIDFRGLPDEYMKSKAMDYFENSRRATYVQREYCIQNPRGFCNYSGDNWGLTASDGPGPATRTFNGRKQHFYGYRARGVPFGPDDGTLAPWAAITSLPFAPEIVLPTIGRFFGNRIDKYAKYGFAASFNPSFACSHPTHRWESPYNFGLNQGPLIIMIENYRSGLIWQLMRKCQPIIRGLQRAGFSGAWLPNKKVQ